MAAIKNEGTTTVELGWLLDAGDGAMVMLVAGETQLAVHRALLEARSPALAAMLRPHDDQLSLPDVEGAVLRQLISYLYTLQAPNLPGVASRLLPAAHRFGVSGLNAHCEQLLAAELDVENAAATAVLALKYGCPGLVEVAVAFIRDNSEVMATQGWADAVQTEPRHVVELSRLLAGPPADVSAPTTVKRRRSSGPDTDRGLQTPTAAAAERHTPPMYGRHLGRLSASDRERKLINAAMQGAVEEMRTLMALGVNVGFCGVSGRTALHWAASEGQVEAARCLVEGGMLVNIISDVHETPLHVAVVSGHTAVVRFLLAARADSNARNNWGRTPLHWAAVCGNAEAAAALLEAGASRHYKDKSGRTPLDYARQSNHQQLVEML